MTTFGGGGGNATMDLGGYGDDTTTEIGCSVATIKVVARVIVVVTLTSGGGGS